jgi:hypothetical protein
MGLGVSTILFICVGVRIFGNLHTPEVNCRLTRSTVGEENPYCCVVERKGELFQLLADMPMSGTRRRPCGSVENPRRLIKTMFPEDAGQYWTASSSCDSRE